MENRSGVFSGHDRILPNEADFQFRIVTCARLAVILPNEANSRAND
jgi:hypothetical protein